MSEELAWPGRGPGSHRSSSAWMFPTPEDIRGRLPKPVPALPELAAFCPEFHTRNQEISLTSESRRSKKNGQNNIGEAAGKAGPQASSQAKNKTETSEQGQISRSTDEAASILRNEGHLERVSLLRTVEETVRRYRMQSPAHFTLHIDIELAETGHRRNRDPSKSQLNITFQNYSKKFNWKCKRYLKKGRPTQKIVVCTNLNGFGVPLLRLLATHFPVSEAWTNENTLRDYWNTNGQSFNWAKLPTELKEHVIQFCIVMTPSHPDSFHDITWLRTFDAPKIKNLRTCELIDRLSRWKSLLRVSTQVRAITLRLCFNGSLAFDKGLCMTSYSLHNFSDRFSALEQFSQITEPNCVPTNISDPGHLLRVVYRDAPKLYPELKRYGTFAQEVREIDLSFDLINFYRFFKVEKGGFGKEGHSHCLVTYDVLEKMPHLNRIVIRLPGRQHWTNKTHQIERPLFDTDFPCLRMVFRILYERIAEALAAYNNVSVTGFLDDTEEERFWGLRQTALKVLQDAELPKPFKFKLTIEELQELGTHDGGGHQLTPKEKKQVLHEKKKQCMVQQEKKNIKQLLDIFQEPPVEQFYPIRCECAVSCQEQYGPGW